MNNLVLIIDLFYAYKSLAPESIAEGYDVEASFSIGFAAPSDCNALVSCVNSAAFMPLPRSTTLT